MTKRTNITASSDADPDGSPDAMTRAIDRFSMLHVLSGRVLKAWIAWQRSIEKGPLGERPAAEDVRFGLAEGITTYRELETRKAERRARTPHKWQSWSRHYDAYDDMEFAVDRWREALDAARTSLPEIADLVDDQREPPLKRWTAQVQRLLGKFGGHINRYTEGEVPDQLDEMGFEQCVSEVYEKLNDLKSIPKGGLSRSEQRSTAQAEQVNAAYGAMMQFIERTALLAHFARDPSPSGTTAAGMNYGMAMVAWIDLQTLLTGSVRAAARACYSAGAPPIRLGKLKPSPSIMEAVADQLGVVVRNAVYLDRMHPLQGVAGESPPEARERLGVQRPLEGWLLFQTEWDGLSPERRAFALRALRCSSIDFDEVQVLAVREAECATLNLSRFTESGTGVIRGSQADESLDVDSAESVETDDAAMLAPRDLARLLGVEQRALEKRLQRWRSANIGSTEYVEIADRTSRQPRFLYRLGRARHVAVGMNGSAQPSHNPSHKRRTKKK